MNYRNAFLPFRHIDVITAIAEHGSISAAAIALDMTQSALTKALRRAETELNVRLFERGPRGVEPTVFGRALFEHAKLIRRQCSDAMNALQALGAGPDSVCVGSGASFLDALLPRAIARLVGRSPAVKIALQIDTMPTLFERLREGRLDLLFIAEAPGIRDTHDLNWTPLISDDMDVVARSGHPLSMRSWVPIAELRDYGWVLGGATDPQQQRIEDAFRAHGIVPPEPTVETLSRAVTVQIVRQSDLLALLPNSRIHPQSHGLARVPCPEAAWSRVAGIVHRKGVTLPPSGEALIEELKLVCGEYYEELQP